MKKVKVNELILNFYIELSEYRSESGSEFESASSDDNDDDDLDLSGLFDSSSDEDDQSQQTNASVKRKYTKKIYTKVNKNLRSNSLPNLMCPMINILNEPTVETESELDEWHNARLDEYNSLIKNNTWTLVKKPDNANVIKCDWVYTHKFDLVNNILIPKARLVAKGYA